MLLRRCTDLVPALVARGEAAEANRTLPSETIADAVEADLFRMVVPRDRGGCGLGLDTLGQTTRVLAHGCVASAWTLSFLVMHNWLLTRFPAEAQDELFADPERPWALGPAPLAPGGKATPVDGGFVVSGRWEWATGVNHAEWVMAHAIVERSDAFETRFVVVPVADVAIEDVWFTSGMRATGSNAVRFDEVFVPSHRTVVGEDLRAPAPRTGDADLAHYPMTPVLALVAAGPAVGAAEAAVEGFRERMLERVLAYSVGDRQRDQPAAQVRLATAIAQSRAARAVWDTAIAQVNTACAGEEPPSVPERMDARLAAAHAVRLAREAIATVCDGSGASVYATSSLLQRFQRDVEVLKGHVIFDWDRCAELAGRIALGMELRPGDMV